MSLRIPSIEEYVESVNERIYEAQRNKKQHIANRLQTDQKDFISAFMKLDEYHKNRVDR
ncbi:MAG: hypothetical protein MK132_26220 [Lentisphaerales bacterium]|nr:hypothetical protein [Lentisphaerales bacterium]